MGIVLEQPYRKPYVFTEIVNGKRKTVYHRPNLVPPSLKVKTLWKKDAKRVVKLDSPAKAFVQYGGDRFGLYSFNQTRPVKEKGLPIA